MARNCVYPLASPEAHPVVHNAIDGGVGSTLHPEDEKKPRGRIGIVQPGYRLQIVTALET
jgi:hypothetical protein